MALCVSERYPTVPGVLSGCVVVSGGRVSPAEHSTLLAHLVNTGLRKNTHTHTHTGVKKTGAKQNAAQSVSWLNKTDR